MRKSSLVKRYCAENVTGLKVRTEAAGGNRSCRGRGAFLRGRSRTGRYGGLVGRENAGISSERQVRILPAESLRIPEEGSSAQGKPGPKPRQRMRRRWTTGGNSSATEG